MGELFSIQGELQKVVGLVRRYFLCRMQQESLNLLNEIIRDLRVVLQHLVTHYFFQLNVEKRGQFQTSLSDQLNGICLGLKEQCNPQDHDHHEYCVREVMICFDWAQKIIEEVPNDPVTQKVLAIDIPILRPFDYGLQKTKSVLRPSKKRL